jgi:hypothetical protein
VQTDPPVLDPSGFYWVKMQFDSGVSGWSSGYPPYLVALSPPQMIQGANFSIAGDYNGPAITQAVCIIDGVNSAAVLNLQPTSGGQQGTLICAVAAPAVGNHKAVIRTENNAGSAASPEFQYAVTSAPIPQPPNAPSNLRITPVGK